MLSRIWFALSSGVLVGVLACEFPAYEFSADAPKRDDANDVTSVHSPEADAGVGSPDASDSDVGLPGSGNGTGSTEDVKQCDPEAALVLTCNGVACTSCRELKTFEPCTQSGSYTIDPDGSGGSLAPLEAYCDMAFDGGGWTLILSTHPPDGPYALRIEQVDPGTSTFLAPVIMQALAANAQQVHLRTAGKPDTESVTSQRNNRPILNLRQGKLLNSGLPLDDLNAQLSPWTGPYARPEILRFTCSPPADGYPSIYAACGTSGLHLIGPDSRWNKADEDTNQNQALEVFIR